MGGYATTYDALKLAGFRVSKITIVKTGERIHLDLSVTDLTGKTLQGFDGKPIHSTFYMEAPSILWGNMVH